MDSTKALALHTLLGQAYCSEQQAQQPQAEEPGIPQREQALRGHRLASTTGQTGNHHM